MDYRELLIKYIAHIVNQESIDYIDYINDGWHSDLPITEEEREQLKKLAKEASKYHNR